MNQLKNWPLSTKYWWLPATMQNWSLSTKRWLSTNYFIHNAKLIAVYQIQITFLLSKLQIFFYLHLLICAIAACTNSSSHFSCTGTPLLFKHSFPDMRNIISIPTAEFHCFLHTSMQGQENSICLAFRITLKSLTHNIDTLVHFVCILKIVYTQKKN